MSTQNLTQSRSNEDKRPATPVLSVKKSNSDLLAGLDFSAVVSGWTVKLRSPVCEVFEHVRIFDYML